MSTTDKVIGVIALNVVSFVAGATFGTWIEQSYTKNKMVHEGRAEFCLDQNNDRQWRWKEGK